MGWGWAVVKDVPQVRVADGAADLRSGHGKLPILLVGHVLVANRGPEARPSTAGVELRLGAKELIAAADALVDPLFVVVVVLAGEGPFGTAFARDLVLFAGQLLFPSASVLLTFLMRTSRIPVLRPIMVRSCQRRLPLSCRTDRFLRAAHRRIDGSRPGGGDSPRILGNRSML